MARRSLQTSTVGIEKAKRAFRRTGWTQEELAYEVGIETRQPVWKFFTGKPIERQTFLEICFRLDLDWQEVAALPTDDIPTVKEEQDNYSDIDALVQEVRSHLYNKVQAQCGIVRLLDTAKPTRMEDIYVSVDVLENITSQRWLDISQLQQCSHVEEFNSCNCSQANRKSASAMQAVVTFPKLMLLGKPGSGKTTFLQQVAIRCNQGKLLADKIPIFIRLKNFAEDASETGNYSLLSYISQELGRSNISEQQVETLLYYGKALILLDGLDELQEDREEVQKQIRKLSEKYDRNQFVITCRIAAQQYWFEEFTDIEIADFNSYQIEAFAKKWFVNVGKNSREKGSVKAVQFVQKLQLSENQQIRELAKTPLLLHLACSVFQAKSEFPTKRSDLYKQALDVLLFRWDEARGIKRDESYHQLSLPQKLKLLSQIAAITFEQGQYFFTQSNLLRHVKKYLRTLFNAQVSPEELQFISEAVVKSFSAQHGILVERAQGIYSFSHLTFHEYLTARNIVISYEQEILNKNLTQLTSHMSEPRWREVFLLASGMLENADTLVQLMQQHNNQLIAADDKLQQFLVWLHQKSLSVNAPYKSAAIRAFYLTLDLSNELTLARRLSLAYAIDSRLADRLAPDLALDLAFNRTLSLSLSIHNDPSLDRILALSLALPQDRVLDRHPKLQRSLQELKEQLPAPDRDREKLKKWWNANGQTWVEKLKSLINWCRNVGYQWQFNERQKEVLQQYYAATHLLVDCLNSDCELNSAVREKIEKTLLLPMNQIDSISESANSEYLLVL